jgi:uncharacterized membrane protein
MSVAEGFRAFFSGVFILVAPGLAWSYVLFRRGNIDLIERVALSLGLSVAVVPLAVFWLNRLFDLRITLLNVVLVVCALAAVALALVWVRRRVRPS